MYGKDLPNCVAQRFERGAARRDDDVFTLVGGEREYAAIEFLRFRAIATKRDRRASLWAVLLRVRSGMRLQFDELCASATLRGSLT